MNKRLAQKIADKRGEKYCVVISHVRTRLRFALLRGVLIALTGERGKPNEDKKRIDDMYNVDLNLIPEMKSYETR